MPRGGGLAQAKGQGVADHAIQEPRGEELLQEPRREALEPARGARGRPGGNGRGGRMLG